MACRKWNSAFRAKATRRTIKVRLVLTHSRLPDRGFKLSISGGWHSHLDILEHKLRGETPPGFWDIWRKYDGAYDARYD